MRPQPGSVRRKLAGLGLAQWPGLTPGMAYWRALVFCVLIALFFGGVNSLPARAGYAPFCADGGSPFFRDELAYLKEEVGRPMGQPIECAHRDDVTGDTLQHTSTGTGIRPGMGRLGDVHRWLASLGAHAGRIDRLGGPRHRPARLDATSVSSVATIARRGWPGAIIERQRLGQRQRRAPEPPALAGTVKTAIRIRTPTTMSRPRATTIIEAGTTTTSPRRHHRAPPSLRHRHRRRLPAAAATSGSASGRPGATTAACSTATTGATTASASGSAATTGSSSARAAARRGSAARPLSRPSYESALTRSAGGILRTRTERTRVAARRPAARAA